MKVEKGGKTGWYGTQHGTVYLSDRKLRVNKPRLRNKGQGKGVQVEIPAYEAMNTGEGVSRRMLLAAASADQVASWRLPSRSRSISASPSTNGTPNSSPSWSAMPRLLPVNPELEVLKRERSIAASAR